jgi:predicted Ser/Thr protein kinase
MVLTTAGNMARAALGAFGLTPNTVRKYSLGLVNVRTPIKRLEGAIRRSNNTFLNADEELVKKLGNTSANGAVFKIRGPDGKFRVLKIVKSNSSPNREFKFQKLAGEYGLAPRVYKVKKNIPINLGLATQFFSAPPTKQNLNKGKVSIGAIIMNNLQKKPWETVWSFNDYMDRLSNGKTPAQRTSNREERTELLSDLWSMVLKLEKLGIVHGDLHPWNVYVVRETSHAKPRVVIIDFGRSTNISTQTRSMTLNSLLTRHKVFENKEYGNQFFTPRVGKGNLPVILNKSKLKMFTNYYKVNEKNAERRAIAKTRNFLNEQAKLRRPLTPGGQRRHVM